jgi:3-hydroxyethyl bacteriochlorophyllide a dehydrogenase
MKAQAIIFEKPGSLVVDHTELNNPGSDDLVVKSLWSGISTGTERLLWTGEMPPFPGMGYPLVPGYETVGEVVEATGANKHRIGERVFVPGCSAYKEVHGLFGGSASHLVVDAQKAVHVDEAMGAQALLSALAATAHHAIAVNQNHLPQLIVGNGVLGRLIARITLALGGEAPVIWETNPIRRDNSEGFRVIDPSQDESAQYQSIIDVSGSSKILDSLIKHLTPRGEITLAGFYSKRVDFAFPSAFMKEAVIRIAAEWKPEDLEAINRLTGEGVLSFENLITHHAAPNDAAAAYETAFSDPECLKMVFNWEEKQ